MFEDIENWPELAEVERPGRYIGGEKEARPNMTPDHRGRLLNVALAFPDVYEIAHGHLGHKIIYSLINERPGLCAERVYAPWPDWEAVLRRRDSLLSSLETRRPLNRFDVVGFSLQYELGYSNILNMLELGGIPLKASDRDHRAPLIVAGGPGAYNPEPLADFFDIFFLGDAEKNFLDDLEIIKEWQTEKAPKVELFQRLAGRPGIYIPSFFEPKYGPDGRFAGLTALKPGYERVVRAVVPDLENAPFPLCQITPLIKPVHDRIVVEIGRGCSRGCRFCQAGYVYRPVRERRRETILELAGRNLESSGQDETSFLSLSAGDHTQISSLVSGFMDSYADRGIALSLPSLRVKSLSGHLASQIKRVRKTGFTLAPEAGTQRLRDVINKDLTDDDLMAAADEAFSLGWRTLKLYFMVGLPSETDEDLAGIAALMRRLKKLGRAQLNLGVAHFTPKAHTPFQWHPASSARTISDRLFKVRDLTRAPGLTPKWNAPGASWVESILARGDRRLGRVLALVHKAGARFEAWGDRFDPEVWIKALAAENLAEEILLNPFQLGQPRPYGHLYAGVEDDFLLRELDKSKKAETTADCRWSECHNCGACHDGAKIDLASPTMERADPPRASAASGQPADPALKAGYLINFSKKGGAAFLGHLELVEMFKRAFRRAGLKLALTEGYHPQPKMSFLTALPLGVPSLDEYLKVVTRGWISPDVLAEKLSAALPRDIKLGEVRLLPPGKNKILAESVVWRINLPEARPEGLEALRLSPRPLYPEAVLSYIDKKRKERRYFLADFVEEAWAENDAILLKIRLGLNGTPKPLPAAAALWGLDPKAFSQARLSKDKTILTG